MVIAGRYRGTVNARSLHWEVQPRRGGALTRPPMPEGPPLPARRTSPKFPRHCEEGKARRGNPHPKQCEALPAPAGVGRGTDCHVASLLAMTVVVEGWSFRFGAVIIGAWRAILESPLQFYQPPEFRSLTAGPA